MHRTGLRESEDPGRGDEPESEQEIGPKIAPSEIATTAALQIQKSILAVPFVRLNIQGDANSRTAKMTLYRSSADSLRHFLMAQAPSVNCKPLIAGNNSVNVPGFPARENPLARP